MEKTYNPNQIQDKFSKIWEQNKCFKTQIIDTKPNYAIMLPPPNVTGSLHMGHAFQHTIMDILIRTHKMQGDNVLWQAGTDHAGIATQMVVERQLQAENKTRYDLGREKFIERIWSWRQESGSIITNQMRKLGTAVDWERERFTMDEGLSAAVTKVFVDLYNKGLIYRGKRLVNWDPVLQTAVSDLEVVSTEENGKLWYIKYPINGTNEFLTIATTRPETMLGDTAVAVNPNDNKYKKYIGSTVDLPLIKRKIPIIADEYVDMEFGTGCVKITPAHDFNDYEVGKRHSLELINIFDKEAKISLDCNYLGLDRYVARKQILKDLEDLGLLADIKEHKLMTPKGDRTGAVIEPYLTDQWFVKTDGLAKKAIDVVKNNDIRFVPKNWEKTYFNWLENIEDWCISRQIWWGHRIPAYFDQDGNMYVANSLQEAQKQAGENIALRQDDDVLDTWFSSALWPFSTLGWPENTKEMQSFYPTSVLVTGFDIIFFWVSRMIMFGLEFTDDVPFRDIYITGLVLDGNGDKMSKSKGNILDPLDIIYGASLEQLLEKRTKGMMQPQLAEKIKKQTKKEFPNGISTYGVDALRFNFAATASFGRDIKFDLSRVEGYRNFCNKIWNASRFVFSSVRDITEAKEYQGDLSTIDKWILSSLEQLKINTSKHREDYRFDLLANEIYDFVWHNYCDWYLEFAKPTITSLNTQYTLLRVLEEILKLLHPIIPFITEEIYSNFNSQELLINTSYPIVNREIINLDAQNEVKYIQEIILGIRKIRADMNIAPNKKLNIFVENAEASLEKYTEIIKQVAKLDNIIYVVDKEQEYATTIAVKTKILIPLKGLINPKEEIFRLNKEIAKLQKQVDVCENKLGNKNFVNNAKAEIVAIEKSRLKDNTNKILELTKQLDKIKNL